MNSVLTVQGTSLFWEVGRLYFKFPLQCFVFIKVLATLNNSVDKLLGPFEEILPVIKSFDEVFTDGEYLVKAALNVNISSSRFDKLKKQYELQNNVFLNDKKHEF